MPEPPDSPPETARHPIVERVFGETFVDPYRWLEDSGSEETRAWIAAENSYTDGVLADRPEVARLRSDLDSLLRSLESVERPAAGGGRLFFLRRRPGHNQPALMHLGEDGAEHVLYDPEREDPSALSSIDWMHPSSDGRRIAFGVSRDGTEDSVLFVADVTTASLLPDRIPHTRFCALAWLRDGSGFYYTRHPEPGSVPPGEEFYHGRVFFHRLGTPATEDPKVFGDGRPMKERYSILLDEDRRALYILAGDGWRRTSVFRLSLQDGGVTNVLDGFDATFEGRVAEGSLIFLTNHRAPAYRIVAVDPERADERSWRTVLGESPDQVLRSFAVNSGRLLVHALRDVRSTLMLIDLDTLAATPVDLPGIGTVEDVEEGPDEGFVVTYTSFVKARTIYHVDPRTASLKELAAGTTPPIASELDVRQEVARSRDGTPVRMTIVARRGLPPGPRPTMLTGYGGFNIARTSMFFPEILPWLAYGGVFVQANMRGGGEYGDAWHRAGMLDKKQRVFEDFFAAAEHLIATGVTDREHFAAHGRSNGGLLMGACLTQRPDLFKAVVSGVPLLDMLRFDRFLIGALWTTEYGDPADEAAFRWLRAYSPYHNVRLGTVVPATYFYAAMDDGRVDALHARKMTALLQDTLREVPDAPPILMRTEFHAGHGMGKPVGGVIAEQAEIWGFAAWQCGLLTPAPFLKPSTSVTRTPGEQPCRPFVPGIPAPEPQPDHPRSGPAQGGRGSRSGCRRG